MRMKIAYWFPKHAHSYVEIMFYYARPIQDYWLLIETRVQHNYAPFIFLVVLHLETIWSMTLMVDEKPKGFLLAQ